MFGKKSDEYKALKWKLAKCTHVRNEEEWLPVKSDLNNMSKKELVKFKEEIYRTINTQKSYVEKLDSAEEERIANPYLKENTPSYLIGGYKSLKEDLKLIYKFLETFEANLPPEE